MYVGPYLTEASGIYKTAELCDKLGIPSSLRMFMNQYYTTIPCISDSSVMEAFLETIGENIYGVGEFKIEYLKEETKGDTEYLTLMDNNNYEDIMQRLEYRYSLEEKVIDSISRGDFNTAMKYSTATSTTDLQVLLGVKKITSSLSTLSVVRVQKEEAFILFIWTKCPGVWLSRSKI